MPTYTYRCESCGFGKDEWLKMSEARAELACPSCGEPSYRKQISAPAFHLKGGGWYASDFRGNGSGADKQPETAKAEPAGAACACPAAHTCPAAQSAAPASGSSTGSN